ncbi:MAG: hypothetical protein ACR2QJ_05585 [Geminicoccaceae bacterium]
MQGLGHKVFEPDGKGLGEQASDRPAKKPVLPAVRSSVINPRLSAFGMALGYLGLVAVLTLAPVWQQAAVPHQGQPLVCTDFGGSR